MPTTCKTLYKETAPMRARMRKNQPDEVLRKIDVPFGLSSLVLIYKAARGRGTSAPMARFYVTTAYELGKTAQKLYPK